MVLRHLNHTMEAKNLDTGHPVWTKSPQPFYVPTQALKLLLQGRENIGDSGCGPLGKSEDGAPLRLCHVPEVLSRKRAHRLRSFQDHRVVRSQCLCQKELTGQGQASWVNLWNQTIQFLFPPLIPVGP